MSEQSQRCDRHHTENRRKFLQVVSVAGLIPLAGCTLSVDDTGISWGDDDAARSDTTDESDASNPGPRATASRYEVTDFEVTSHTGNLDIYGSIKMRGVYNESEYINPRGRSSWDVLEIDEGNYLAVEEGSAQDIIVTDTTIEFPPEAIDDLDASEPFIIVRVDLIERREANEDVFLGWDSARVFLDEIDGQVESEEITMQFTADGNDVRLSYVVTPIYD